MKTADVKARAFSVPLASPRIGELAEFHPEDLHVKGGWEGPAGLELHSLALALVAQLPAREVLCATHILSDLTPGLGRVVHDYMADGQ